MIKIFSKSSVNISNKAAYLEKELQETEVLAESIFEDNRKLRKRMKKIEELIKDCPRCGLCCDQFNP